MTPLTPWFPKFTRWSVRLEFKPADLWVGAYWNYRDGLVDRGLDIWICLLPMLPIHITENGWRKTSKSYCAGWDPAGTEVVIREQPSLAEMYQTARQRVVGPEPVGFRVGDFEPSTPIFDSGGLITSQEILDCVHGRKTCRACERTGAAGPVRDDETRVRWGLSREDFKRAKRDGVSLPPGEPASQAFAGYPHSTDERDQPIPEDQR